MIANEKNKNSNDMKEQLTIISDDLNHGIITEKEARTKLLILFGVSTSEVFEAYGKPFTSGRDLWDWLKINCEIRLKT